MPDIKPKSLPNPLSQMNFTQLRQAFQNVGIKVTKRSIQSYDYVAGVSGWKIDSNGDVEFNNGTFRGTLESGAIYIPSQAAPKFSVDSQGNAIVSSLRRNDFVWFTIFESIDGYSKNRTGAAIETLGYQSLVLTTGLTSGDNFYLAKSFPSGFNAFTWDKNRRIKMGVSITSGNSAYEARFGMGDFSSSTVRHIGFFVNSPAGSNYDLYASVSNNSSESLIKLGTFNFGIFQNLEIRWTAGIGADYYIDDVFILRVTTTLPSTNDLSATHIADISLKTTGGVQVFTITYIDFWQAN